MLAAANGELATTHCSIRAGEKASSSLSIIKLLHSQGS
jgi:hypothetical protein